MFCQISRPNSSTVLNNDAKSRCVSKPHALTLNLRALSVFGVDVGYLGTPGIEIFKIKSTLSQCLPVRMVLNGSHPAPEVLKHFLYR